MRKRALVLFLTMAVGGLAGSLMSTGLGTLWLCLIVAGALGTIIIAFMQPGTPTSLDQLTTDNYRADGLGASDGTPHP